MAMRAFMITLLLIAAGLVGARACSGTAEESIVTPQLAGVWTTSSPGHFDRFLEIRPGEIVFGQGEAGEARYPILGVTRTPRPRGNSKYLVRYRLDKVTEAEGTLEVLVGPAGLRILSQPRVLWTERR
jgi:hypothetical protein